jgi:hypothetical protein
MQPITQKNMGSKKKAEEDITCEEHGNPPKKRKIDEPIDSLLLEVENQNVTYLKYFVEQATGNFPLSEQWRIVFIPVPSDATISDQIIDILKRKYPGIELVKKEKKTKNLDCLIPPPDADTEKLIEVLEWSWSALRVFFMAISVLENTAGAAGIKPRICEKAMPFRRLLQISKCYWFINVLLFCRS